MIIINNKDIIDIINKYKLDKEQFIVISGAALALNNIKETTNDIDIWCDEGYYNYLLKNYKCDFEKTDKYGNKVYLIDNIINFGVSFKPKEINIINGIKVASLEDTLELKKIFNREKDKIDIDLINSRIKK